MGKSSPVLLSKGTDVFCSLVGPGRGPIEECFAGCSSQACGLSAFSQLDNTKFES